MKAATACAKVDVKSSRSIKLAEPKLMAAVEGDDWLIRLRWS